MANYVRSLKFTKKNQSQYSESIFRNYNRGGRVFKGRGGNKQSEVNRPICQIYGKIGYSVVVCYHMFDKSYMGMLPDSNSRNQHQQSVYLSSTDSIAYQTWFIDNGTNCHTTNDANNIQHKSIYHDKETLIVENHEKLNICHIRLVKLLVNKKTFLLLKETLHIPEIEKNLISLSKLVVLNNVDVEFNSLSCFVKDKASRKILLQEKHKEGLY